MITVITIQNNSLDEVVGEVSALYAQLEAALVRASLRKAVAIDEPLGGTGCTSSCLEDAFFIAQVRTHAYYHILPHTLTRLHQSLVQLRAAAAQHIPVIVSTAS
jgi:hypothetical protein